MSEGRTDSYIKYVPQVKLLHFTVVICLPVLDTPTTLLGSLIMSSMTAIMRNSYHASYKQKKKMIFQIQHQRQFLFII